MLYEVITREAVIRSTLDVKPSYAETLRSLGAAVIDRLAAVLPGLALQQSEWVAALRADEGLCVGDLVARLALALQHAAGIDGALAWSELNRITSYNVCYTKLLRLDAFAKVRNLVVGAGDGREHVAGNLVITSYSIHYTKLYDTPSRTTR